MERAAWLGAGRFICARWGFGVALGLRGVSLNWGAGDRVGGVSLGGILVDYPGISGIEILF